MLDAGILALHFADHQDVRSYFDTFDSGRSRGLIAGVNLAEFYYKTCQKLGKQTADTWYFQLRNTNLEIRQDDEVVRQAGLEKCRHPSGLSIADCFALALARLERAMLLTTDSELARIKDVEVRHIRL